MTFDKKQLFALFIIVIMIFSTFGYVVLSSSAFNNVSDTNESSIDSTSGITISYEADSNAVVRYVTSSYYLAGYTSELDITKIESAIRSVKGVSQVVGQFDVNSNSSIATNYRYSAQVVAQGTDKNAFFTNVSLATSGILSELSIFPYAQVIFDSNLQMINSDLNITKTYNFTSPIGIVVVNPLTDNNDTISAKLFITFRGNTPISVTGYELSNYNAAPQNFQTTLSTKLNYLYDMIYVSDVNSYDLNYIKTISDWNVLDYDGLLIVSKANIDSDINSKLISYLDSVDSNYSAEYKGVAQYSITSLTLDGVDYNYEYSGPIEVPYDYNYDNTATLLIDAYVSRGSIVGLMPARLLN